MENLGQRIRQVREMRHMPCGCYSSRVHTYRIEFGRQSPSLGCIERIADCLETSIGTLLGSQEQFDKFLSSIEDSFTEEVRSCLKRLNAEQRAYILKVLEAAPKQAVAGRPRSGNTVHPISNG